LEPVGSCLRNQAGNLCFMMFWRIAAEIVMSHVCDTVHKKAWNASTNPSRLLEKWFKADQDK
jgi:hypothetical protein